MLFLFREAMQDSRQMLLEREPYYSQADATLDTSGKSIDESLHELTRQVRGDRDAACSA